MGALRAVFWDLGDSIMQETTEEKVDGVTQRAELIPGVKDVIFALRAQGVPQAIVADTRVGTCENVLRQHGLADCFAVRAISETLGVIKPDPLMFETALQGLGIPEDERSRVAMIGNNLARDIKGANALGITSVWFHWNDRYPKVPADASERPDFEVRNAAELAELLFRLDEGANAG